MSFPMRGQATKITLVFLEKQRQILQQYRFFAFLGTRQNLMREYRTDN